MRLPPFFIIRRYAHAALALVASLACVAFWIVDAVKGG
ncbi:hypothetical protein NX02_04565 [Sphingomonas sanxanigenens DSM 19645 = NX02]|uniref:Uncharacterized protein n=1 Tax=Sphingomonas sanxanigenens DSM 19645 = NX02 TaxID=1123269 RepID=W0A6G9_9SPHN|nr:hypothetical protein NX02_04565 [Sphingomonas sanxanigenens DSM 19645 = NX02]